MLVNAGTDRNVVGMEILIPVKGAAGRSLPSARSMDVGLDAVHGGVERVAVEDDSTTHDSHFSFMVGLSEAGLKYILTHHSVTCQCVCAADQQRSALTWRERSCWVDHTPARLMIVRQIRTTTKYDDLDEIRTQRTSDVEKSTTDMTDIWALLTHATATQSWFVERRWKAL